MLSFLELSYVGVEPPQGGFSPARSDVRLLSLQPLPA
jgi:hypothetical protein